MEKLRVLDYLQNIKEYNGVAIEGNLYCSCSCVTFQIYHTGKQTKGMLSPFLVKKNKQLSIKAECSNCGNSIIIYDSKIDGLNHRMINQGFADYSIFDIPKYEKDKYKITVKYNYLPEKLKVDDSYSNDFEECFIDITNNGEKPKRLIEE